MSEVVREDTEGRTRKEESHEMPHTSGFGRLVWVVSLLEIEACCGSRA